MRRARRHRRMRAGAPAEERRHHLRKNAAAHAPWRKAACRRDSVPGPGCGLQGCRDEEGTPPTTQSTRRPAPAASKKCFCI
eukprot:scaffold1883_cov108-Isochrysis_galbana.AAC.5